MMGQKQAAEEGSEIVVVAGEEKEGRPMMRGDRCRFNREWWAHWSVAMATLRMLQKMMAS